MSWALFCQIEVILLTIGLVLSFVISVRQGAKDNSFFKRVSAVGKAMDQYGRSITEKKKDEKHDD